MFEYIELEEPRLQFFKCRPQPRPRSIVYCKPFSYRSTQDKPLYLKLLTDEDTEKIAESVVNNLKSGFGEYYKPFKDVFGMELGFHAEDDVKIVDKDSFFSRLEEAVDDLSAKDGPGIVLIAVNDSILTSKIYYETKKRSLISFSKRNIRVQFIRRPTILRNLRTSGYGFFLLNIATAIYAKAGGTPWKLASPLIPTRGLIIGISFTRKRVSKEEKVKEEIYYGSVQVLDRYGEHLVTRIRIFRAPRTKGLYVPYEDMYGILKDVFRRYGRIPFVAIHKSSSFANEEVRAINDVLRGYSGKFVKPGLLAVHIKGDTIYRCYDKSYSDLCVRRGALLIDKLRNDRAILFTTGRVGERERKRLGTPRSLELSIHTNTLSLDVKNIAEQILALTKLDWNTTELEVRRPITLKYSRRAARLAPYMLTEDTADLYIGDIRDLM